MRSIEAQLSIWLHLGIGCTLLAAFGITYVMARDGMTLQFDEALSSEARALGSLLDEDHEGIEVHFADESMPAYTRSDAPDYFQIWLADGGVLERSRGLEGHDLPRRAGLAAAPLHWDLTLPDGRAGRAVGLRVPIAWGEEDDEEFEHDPQARGGGPRFRAGSAPSPIALVVVARGRAPLDIPLRNLLNAIIAIAVIASFVTTFVVSTSIRRGLAPLHGLAAKVSCIDARNLDQRLPSAAQVAELAPLTGKLNELLARIEESFQREKRITASMAHELRTPIAEILSASDVARKWSEDQDLRDDAIRTAHAVAKHMSAVVASLLRLSRLESGKASLELKNVDLGELISRSLISVEPKARDKGITIDAGQARKVQIHCDLDLLTIIVGNIINNAIEHTGAPGCVQSILREGAEGIVWTLSNSPVDLAREDLPHLAEALWRKETARSARDHLGLGLTLVQAAAAPLGISLEYRVEEGLFSATLCFPRSPG